MWREKLLLKIAWGKFMTHILIGKWKIFEILLYRCRKFLQLGVQNEFTTRIQKWKSTGGMCFYEKQYFIINIKCFLRIKPLQKPCTIKTCSTLDQNRS